MSISVEKNGSKIMANFSIPKRKPNRRCRNKRFLKFPPKIDRRRSDICKEYFMGLIDNGLAGIRAKRVFNRIQRFILNTLINSSNHSFLTFSTQILSLYHVLLVFFYPEKIDSELYNNK